MMDLLIACHSCGTRAIAGRIPRQLEPVLVPGHTCHPCAMGGGAPVLSIATLTRVVACLGELAARELAPRAAEADRRDEPIGDPDDGLERESIALISMIERSIVAIGGRVR